MTRLLMVVWRDAEGAEAGWIEAAAAKAWALDDNSALCVSFGLLIAETEQYLVLVGSVNSRAWGEVQKIPKGMVIVRQTVKQWQARRARRSTSEGERKAPSSETRLLARAVLRSAIIQERTRPQATGHGAAKLPPRAGRATTTGRR